MIQKNSTAKDKIAYSMVLGVMAEQNGKSNVPAMDFNMNEVLKDMPIGSLAIACLKAWHSGYMASRLADKAIDMIKNNKEVK